MLCDLSCCCAGSSYIIFVIYCDSAKQICAFQFLSGLPPPSLSLHTHTYIYNFSVQLMITTFSNLLPVRYRYCETHLNCIGNLCQAVSLLGVLNEEYQLYHNRKVIKHNAAPQEHCLCFQLSYSCFIILNKLLQISRYLYLILIQFKFCLLKLFIRANTFSLAFCVFCFVL